MKHTCHAKDCDKTVPRKMLMCKKHWFMVPKPLRDAVWDTYTPGQEDGDGEITPSWHEAADAAIKAVADKEARG